MNSISASSPAMSDLDGYSISGDYNYAIPSRYNASNEDFGFDPPQTSSFSKSDEYNNTSIADSLQLAAWGGFDGADNKDTLLVNRLPSPEAHSIQDFELEKLLSQPLSQGSANLRFGQVTPPRSNSASSEDKVVGHLSLKASTSERRKRSTKAAIKEESDTAQTNTTSRKRKNRRKSSPGKDEQDNKRKQSLEKNRLAAAKCRVNKKEKTEQLQRNSHEKAVHNAFLKEQVMRMKEEVQQMNALLLAHANCEGCKSPGEIQKHLSHLGNEFFAQHMSSLEYEYPQVNLDEMPHLGQGPTAQGEYFGHRSGATMLNPPLPDFDRAAEFEVHTPMQTD